MRFKDIDDIFPFGHAAFIILLLAVIAGMWLVFHPVERGQADITMWVFADTHYNAYKKSLPSFEEQHFGEKVDIQLVIMNAIASRLRAAFWADLPVPDLVEAEISTAGSFFRGPVDEIGFLDVKPWLMSTGLYDRIVKTRFSPYMREGHIFGLPHDVHPVMLAYRRDICEELGIDISNLTTWEEFIREGRRVTKLNERYMIEFSDSGAAQLEVLLFQRGGGYVDEDGNLIMDNDVAIDTLKWYVPLAAGPNRIGSDLGIDRIFTQALEEGYFIFCFCPDWRTKFIEQQVPRVSGKMALMPLPAWEPGGRRTTTMGGTMLGIPRESNNIDRALELARHLYFNTDDLAERFKETNIIPPVKDAWGHPAFDEPDPYWSNQALGRLFVDLAEDVPPQYASPFVIPAKAKFAEALCACVRYYRVHGDEGFDEFVRKRLKQAADDVRKLMARDPF